MTMILLRMYVFVTLPVMIGISILGLIIWGLWELHQKIIRTDIRLWNCIVDTLRGCCYFTLFWFVVCFIIQPVTLQLFWGGVLSLSIFSLVISTIKNYKLK